MDISKAATLLSNLGRKNKTKKQQSEHGRMMANKRWEKVQQKQDQPQEPPLT